VTSSSPPADHGSAPAGPSGWDGYVGSFHALRPGITEAVLGRCVDRCGATPYAWVARRVGRGPILDVGCGSGPSQPLTPVWVGVDRSMPELAEARHRGRGPLIAAAADALPVADGAVGSVTLVMSLMVVDDPSATLGEIRRVLRPGGSVAVLVPTDGPLTVADRLRYAGLLAVLGRRALPFPQPGVLDDPRRLLEAHGFEVREDARRRFGLALRGRRDAERFVDSLYLPDVPAGRVRLAVTLVRSWGPSPVGVPLRLLVAHPRVGLPRSAVTAGDAR
jgi:SAM-dependent methyltransferase